MTNPKTTRPSASRRRYKDGFWFDAVAADRAVQFFERCLTHVKGELAGQPLPLDARLGGEVPRRDRRLDHRLRLALRQSFLARVAGDQFQRRGFRGRSGSCHSESSLGKKEANRRKPHVTQRGAGWCAFAHLPITHMRK